LVLSPVTDTPDDRSPLARAMEWATLATTVAAEMVVPVLIGYWIDHRLGNKFVFTTLGGIVGLTFGIWSLVRMAESSSRGRGKNQNHDSPHDPGAP